MTSGTPITQTTETVIPEAESPGPTVPQTSQAVTTETKTSDQLLHKQHKL